jgi:hypothetical protein
LIEYIDLKRRFIPIGKDAEPDLTFARVMGGKFAGWLDWSALLDHDRVVLLAEAESGKTREFKHTSERLRAGGSASFYTTVDELAEGQLTISPIERTLFEQWKAGSERAWFFLDSVDEARLNQKRFDAALRVLSGELGPVLARARILISCRASDWKTTSDPATILELLPTPKSAPPPIPPDDPDAFLLDPIFERNRPPKDDEKSTDAQKLPLLIVQLAPLSNEQRRLLLAKASGVQDANAFNEAISRQGLDALAARPGDVLELAKFWTEHHRFGTLAAMSEEFARFKLVEMDRYRPDNSVLPYSKAREGAERLAAALTLGKSFTLLAPGQEPDPSLASGALDPIALLDGWTVAECNALLRRGVFEPSTYGRIRFHHRSTQEYLTAKWLQRLLDEGPRSEIFKLIFAERYGVETVVPSLRPAAAWLALANPDFRDEIIKREPLLLIQHGDPAGLPFEAKGALLLSFAARHAAGEISDDRIDRREISVFASPDLADTIRTAWKLNKRLHFRTHLLRLIREGRISACVDLAYSMACDAAARDYNRIVAVQALIACEATQEIDSTVSLLTSEAHLASPNLAAEFAVALFPKHLTLAQLLNLIRKSKKPRNFSPEGFAHAIDALWSACPVDQRGDFIAGIAELSAEEPYVHEYQRVSSRYQELAQHLGPIARDAVIGLGDSEPSADLLKLLGVVERAERPGRPDDNDPPLSKLIQTKPKLNQALFWYDVDEVRHHHRHQNPLVNPWQVHFGGTPLWALSQPDLPWLLEDLEHRDRDDHRRMALGCIAAVFGHELHSESQALRKIIKSTPALVEALDGYLTPPAPSQEMRQYEREAARLKAETRREQERAAESWRRFRDDLLSNPRGLADPAQVSTDVGLSRLKNLTNWLHLKTGKDYQQAALEWRLLDNAFSPAVAEAYRDGMMAVWRKVEPERPQRTEGGPLTVKWTTILAYAGLSIEATDSPGFGSRFTKEEARRAALHGCVSEQGYPDWIDPLARLHPATVVPDIREAFATEWSSEDTAVSYFLYRYSQPSNSIPTELEAELYKIITTIEPRQLQILDRGLNIARHLTARPEWREGLGKLATACLRQNQGSRPDWAIRYLALLFLVDVPQAANALLSWLRKTKRSERATLSLKVIGSLFGHHDPLVPIGLNGAPVSTLAQLLLFAYQEVRPEDDTVHEGVYSPGERDEAEWGRNALLKALIETTGPSAHDTMLGLSRHRDMRGRKIRFREMAREMAERDAEIPAWNAEEVLKFERDHVLPVKTGLDLYRLTQALIKEIDWDFENQDASSRAVLETAKDENAVQNWLHEQLRHRAKDRFHATREPEVAEGNMPDILVSAVAVPVEIAVEAKHGGKGWSTKALEDALRGQLAEDYLRPLNRRHGVFVITNHRRRSWTHPHTGKRFNFSEMIAYLNGVASNITSNAVGDVNVTVIGIDALPRKRRRSTSAKAEGRGRQQRGPKKIRKRTAKPKRSTPLSRLSSRERPE